MSPQNSVRWVFLSAADPVVMSFAAAWLNRQPKTGLCVDDPPLLTWDDESGSVECLRGRIERWLPRAASFAVGGDAAAAYLPHWGRVAELLPEAKLVYIRRPLDETIADTLNDLQQRYLVPTTHWAEPVPPTWQRDPVRARAYPKFDEPDFNRSVARYVQLCEELAQRWAAKFPDRVRIVDAARLDEVDQQRELLTFLGYEPTQHIAEPRLWSQRTVPSPPHAVAATQRPGVDPFDPRRCAILVPYGQYIVAECDNSLRELERRGFTVHRVGGFSAVDVARNQMATEAIVRGYDETFWIDSDMIFHPDDIDRLRRYELPITCGVYTKKQSPRMPSCCALPGKPLSTFGKGGGLTEIQYAATGFLHVRREVYLRLLEDHRLPICNEQFGKAIIPFFQPQIRFSEQGPWYLADDFSFCERARQSGYRIFADTSILLKHVGAYPYFWDAPPS